MGALTDKLFVADGDALRRALQPLVAEAVADALDTHVREVRELRRGLFVLKGLLTAHEAGVVLGGVSAATVMGYVRERGLPCYRPGKAPLFRLPDLHTWAERFPEPIPEGSRRGGAHAGGAA